MIEEASNRAPEYGLAEFPVATHTSAGLGSPSGSLSVGVTLGSEDGSDGGGEVGADVGSDEGSDVGSAEAVGSGFLPG